MEANWNARPESGQRSNGAGGVLPVVNIAPANLICVREIVVHAVDAVVGVREIRTDHSGNGPGRNRERVTSTAYRDHRAAGRKGAGLDVLLEDIEIGLIHARKGRELGISGGGGSKNRRRRRGRLTERIVLEARKEK